MASSSSQRRIGLKFESACHILAVVLMLAACPLFAADPNTITVSNFKKTSHNSLTLHRQQSVIQCIELARAAIAREDYVGAIQLMEQAQREPNSFVPAGDDSVVASHEAVKRMWDVIPAETRQRFDEARVGASRREWSSVRTKSLHEVVRFLNLFQDLPISVDALWWIAAHQRDHAQFQQAVSTYLRIVSHQHTKATNRAIAMQAADELIILGAPSVRGEWNQCCSLIDPMTTVDDHGKSTTFGEWVASRNQSVLTEPGELSRSDIDLQRLKGPCSIPVWSHALTVRLEGGLQLHESKLREQGVVPLPIQRPLWTDRLLVIRSLEQISAFDIESGDSRWSIPNIEYSRLRQQVFDNLTYRAEAVDWAQRRSLADSIFGRMSTDGKRLYAVQEPDRDGELKISRDLSRDSHRLGPRYNQLVAYELSTGREIWNIDGAGSDETFANMVFLGVPLVVDDQLYVIGQ